MKLNLTRRNFFKWSVLAIPFFKTGTVLAKVAASCPQGAPTDPKAIKRLIKLTDSAAKRLKFVFNATESKEAKYKSHPGHCGTCRFFNKKKVTADNYSTCAMVGNKYVPSCGWCKSFKIAKK